MKRVSLKALDAAIRKQPSSYPHGFLGNPQVKIPLPESLARAG